MRKKKRINELVTIKVVIGVLFNDKKDKNKNLNNR